MELGLRTFHAFDVSLPKRFANSIDVLLLSPITNCGKWWRRRTKRRNRRWRRTDAEDKWTLNREDGKGDVVFAVYLFLTLSAIFLDQIVDRRNKLEQDDVECESVNEFKID